MRRLALVVAVPAILSVGCLNDQVVQPAAPGAPMAVIMDGAHGGNAFFFFLPPLVPNPSSFFHAGKVNAGLSPVAEVCELTGDPGLPGLAPTCVATVFGPAKMAFDLATGQYAVNWDTKSSSLVTTKFYRILVRGASRGTVLGAVDLDPLEQGVKNVKTGDVVSFQDGRTLPIKVRIEDGAFGSTNPDHVERVVPTSIPTGTLDVTTTTGFAGARFFNGWLPAGIDQVVVIIERVPAHNDTEGTSCLESGLLELEGCYRFRTDPDLHGLGPEGTDLAFQVPVIAGVCVEIPEILHSGAPFQLHRRREQEVEGTLTLTGPSVALPSVEAPFLTCGEFAPTPSLRSALRSGRLLDLASAGWQALVRGVGRLVQPRALYAVDFGAGGSTDAFSRFGWARAATLVKLAATDNQVTLTGTKVLVDPTVCLTRLHPTPRPLVDEPVRFTVTGGGGTVGGGTSTVARTGSTGCASAPWVLGSSTALAGNRLTAAAAALPRTVDFTATGVSVEVEAGSRHSCALNASGNAYCWGINDNGHLGDGTTTDRLVPTLVVGELTFAAVSVGYFHTCGVTPSGAAYCWGGNSFGQLGDGTTADRLVPTAVAGGLTFVAVSAGYSHTCGVTTSGTAYCWGYGVNGHLGDGTTANRPIPTPVAGSLTFAAINAADATCGVTISGAAYCWGPNSNGQLGDNTTIQRLVPTPVAGDLTFAALSGGVYHTCGVTASGAAYCWGFNSNGQLGDNTTTQRLVPTPVAGGRTLAAVSAGDYHNCGVTTSGAVYCWGLNGSGQLGDATTANRLVPTAVAGGLTFAAVSAGDFHTCGATTSGAAYCWGDNGVGQLGVGTLTNRLVPTAVVFDIVPAATVHIDVNNFVIDLRSGRIEDPSRVNESGLFKGTQVLFGAGFAYGSAPENLLVGYSIRGTESDFDASGITVLSRAPAHHTTVQLQPRAGLAGLSDVTVTQESFAFTDPGHTDYVLLKYTLSNHGSLETLGAYAAFVADEDLFFSGTFDDDIVTFNASLDIAEVTERNTAAFPQVVGIVPIAAGFEAALNYEAHATADRDPLNSAGYFPLLSGGLPEGSPSVGPGDVRHVIGFGPFSIPAGGSRVVWFALVGADNQTALQANVDAARAKVQAGGL